MSIDQKILKNFYIYIYIFKIKNTTTKRLKPRQPVSSCRIVRWLLIQIEFYSYSI